MSRTCRSNSSSPNPDTSPGFRSVDGTREAYGNTLKNARPETIVVSRDRIARENQACEEKEKEMKRKYGIVALCTILLNQEQRKEKRLVMQNIKDIQNRQLVLTV